MIGDVVGPAVECDVCRAPQAIELDELSDYRTNDPNTEEVGSVKLSNLKRDWVVLTLSVLQSTQSQHTFAAERFGHSILCRSELRLELLP